MSQAPSLNLHSDEIVVTGMHIKAGKGCVDQSYSKLQFTNVLEERLEPEYKYVLLAL